MRSADGYLIDKCLNGEPEAFGVLVDRYRASMFALAYSKLRNFEDAEDVTQDAFVLAYKNLRKLKQYDSFHAWLYSITSNLCKKLKIKQSRLPDSEFIEDQSPGMMRRASMNSYREEAALESIHEALDSLPQMYREVLTLHYLGGMNSDEIAETLGASPSAIRQRLSRARMQLKEEIITMMSEAFSQRRLSAKFTFNIVEMIKKIKIHPISTLKGMPWGLSLATGLIIAVMSLNPYVNWFSQIGTYVSSVLPSETKVLKVGEIPVDVVKSSNISFISNITGKGKGGMPKQPAMQNAFFMSPKGEGEEWVRKADMPTAMWGSSTSVINGKIYAIGGGDNNSFVSTVKEYDPATDKWTKKADMPTGRAILSTAVVNGKIYAIGGTQDIFGALSIVEEYDPVADKWTKKANMPTARSYLAAGAVNGKIYAIGGWHGNGITYISTVEEYDPATDTWTRKADMPTARGYHSTSVLNGKIYVIGGRLPSAVTCSTMEEYDPATNIWTKKADMLTPKFWLSSSAVNGKIYAIGGVQDLGQGNGLSTVEEYDPVTDTWTKKSDMPTARFALTSSVVNGRIYAVGGVEAWAGVNLLGKLLSTVEEYTPEGWPFVVSSNGKLPTTWGNIKSR